MSDDERAMCDASEALTAAGIPDDGTDLAERIRLLAEDRDAERGMKEKLLDPEFTFAATGMGVMDHRGLIQSMVLGFDEAFRSAPATAQNFITYTFNDRETRRPAYVVTIQRATGKSPAERYIEVATELRELKAATCPACKAAQGAAAAAASGGSLDDLCASTKARCPEHAARVEPLPEEPEAERALPDEHVRLDMDRGCLFCERCGKEQSFGQPIAGNDLAALLDSFGARHRMCKEAT